MIDEREFPAVLAAARAGDDVAMGILFRDLHPRLLRYLHGQEARTAEDLAGEVWLAVAHGLRTFDGDAVGFRAWVFSIARRRVADHRRRGIRRATHPVAPEALVDLAGSDDPARTAVGRVSGQAAAELITSLLPADQAEVILLRVLADLGVDEVAEVMGKTSNWVRVTQHRALRRLAGRLGPRIDVIR